LRDFEKCNTHSRVPESFTHKKCQGIGYIIPKEYEPYEIKKVSEIECKYGVPKGCCYKDCWQCDLIHEYNLKGDDKVVVRVK